MLTSSILTEEGLIKPEARHLSEVKDILNHVQYGEQVVLATHLIVYPYSIYSSLPSVMIEESVSKDFPDFENALKDPDAQFMIERLKDKLNKLYDTPSKRYRDGMKEAIDKISVYLKTAKITDGKDGNITQVRQLVTDGKGLLESFTQVDKVYQEELKSHRGNTEAWDDNVDYSSL